MQTQPSSRVVPSKPRMRSREVIMSAAPTLHRSSPLGATLVDGGVQFSLFSRSATGVDLFDSLDEFGRR